MKNYQTQKMEKQVDIQQSKNLLVLVREGKFCEKEFSFVHKPISC